ncbi:MAG: YveK family protein [Beduini sp.]|uniref:YveK family protein n=1 Tax=Beduini sp. TaxID=1922300 RepID=UPI0011CCA1DA
MKTRNDKVIEFSFMEYIKYLHRNIKVLMFFVIIGVILFGTYNEFIKSKEYKSIGQIMLTANMVDGKYDSDQISSNKSVIKNYIELIKGTDILSTVSKKLNIDIDTLESSITVKNEVDTQVLSITVLTDNPKLSKDIVNEVMNQFISKVKTSFGVTNIEIIKTGIEAKNTTSPTLMNSIVTGMTLAFLFGLCFFFVKYLNIKGKADELS